MKLKKMILTGLFAALIIISTYIRIPVPPLPITLQTAAILLSALVLGKKYGTLSVVLYIALGLFGLPVFANGSGGIGYVLTPSFGYIIGFVVAAFLCGSVAEKNKSSYRNLLVASFLGTVAIYICGYAYCYLIQSMWICSEENLKQLIISFVLIPLPKDVITCFIVSFIGKRILTTMK